MRDHRFSSASLAHSIHTKQPLERRHHHTGWYILSKSTTISALVMQFVLDIQGSKQSQTKQAVVFKRINERAGWLVDGQMNKWMNESSIQLDYYNATWALPVTMMMATSSRHVHWTRILQVGNKEAFNMQSDNSLSFSWVAHLTHWLCLPDLAHHLLGFICSHVSEWSSAPRQDTLTMDVVILACPDHLYTHTHTHAHSLKTHTQVVVQPLGDSPATCFNEPATSLL